MVDQGHLDILKQGVRAWNRWRQTHPEIRPDLAFTDLRRIDLSKANLNETDFYGSNLSNANLKKATFSGASLYNADFSEANLEGVNLSIASDFPSNMFLAMMAVDPDPDWSLSPDMKPLVKQARYLRDFHIDPKYASDSRAELSGIKFIEANLRGANLSKVRLFGAYLNGANLSGANLSGADLFGADLFRATLRGANLHAANLSGANFSATDLRGADLRECCVYATSAWDVDLEGAIQSNLIITNPYARNESVITVDDLEVAQFIYLLLNHKKLGNVLNAVTKRGVLLLGRFGGGGLQVLQAVAAKLREEHYLPIIFDFERPQDRNFTETVKTLAGLSRFVIVDLSGPSVPQELYATVPHFKIPFIPIIKAGGKPFSMAVDLLEYPWVIRPPVTFASTKELLGLIASKIIAPAEEKYQRTMWKDRIGG